MGESHRGVSSARRKLIEEPLKRQKKRGFFVWLVHVCMLPPVTRRQHLLTLLVGVVIVEKKHYLGVCAYVNAGSTFAAFVFRPLRLSPLAVVTSGHLLPELLIPSSAPLLLCSHLLIHPVRH